MGRKLFFFFFAYGFFHSFMHASRECFRVRDEKNFIFNLKQICSCFSMFNTCYIVLLFIFIVCILYGKILLEQFTIWILSSEKYDWWFCTCNRHLVLTFIYDGNIFKLQMLLKCSIFKRKRNESVFQHLTHIICWLTTN